MNKNRIFNLAMVLALVVTSLAVSQPAAAQGMPKFTPRFAADGEAVPGEVVVTFADSEGKNLVEKIEQAVETADQAGGEVARLSLDGSAVISVSGDANAAVSELNNQPGVLYAELNYIYSVPKTESTNGSSSASPDFVSRRALPSSGTDWKSTIAIPRMAIESMAALGTYPNDTYLANNQGWLAVGADIVWPNTTPSVNICEVDTGVDYLHPDLSYTYSYSVRVRRRYYTYYATASRILPGYDFVNADTDPMDDNGHGTHVAGIMVAMQNNNFGISGISTGSVVAVKALDAQGQGTTWDIAKAIKYCADRTDVGVINLSLGGPSQSTAIHDALLYATTPTTSTVPSGAFAGLSGKGKVVVAAAGNENKYLQETYPAGYSNDPEFATNRILSVGATGAVRNGVIDYSCKAGFSNYGLWVNVSAPGAQVYSLTPYDKPFYNNYYSGWLTRFDYQEGTSEAAAFVSAAAARRMGYKPLETAEQVGNAIISKGENLDGTCTTNEMLQAKEVNVAALLDRAGVKANVFDASSGLPLYNASVAVGYVNAGVTQYNTAVVPATVTKDTIVGDPDPNRVATYYGPQADILNIPTVDALGNPITTYQLLVSKAGYTNGYQPAFQQEVLTNATIQAGQFSVFTNGAVPPISSNFDVSLGWHTWRQILIPGNPPTYYKDATNGDDLDLYVWLPDKVANQDPSQPASFIVGYAGNAFGFVEGDPYGTMNDFPFARLKREGGYLDGGPTVETISVAYRQAHGSVLANAALPYWAGTYTFLATDYGQTIDHDADGCGDNFGPNYSKNYTPGGECSGKTPGIPLLGAYLTPYVYVWKDGVVQYFADGSNSHGPWAANTACNKHWWKAFSVATTTTSITPTYNAINTCDNGSAPNFIPYFGVADPTSRIVVSSLDK